jgi:hypothetical protein
MMKNVVLIAEMKRRGFAPFLHRGDALAPKYFFQDIDGELRRFASCRYLAKFQTYDVAFGIEYLPIRKAMRPCLTRLARGRRPISEMLDQERWPCLSMFPINNYVGWGYAGFGANEEPSDCISTAFSKAFTPLFAQVQSTKSLLNLLLRHDEPFEWASSAVFARIAEIACLASITGDKLHDVEPFVAPYTRYLRSDLYGGESPPSILSDIYHCFVQDKTP